MDPLKANAPRFDPNSAEYRRKLWTRVEEADGSTSRVFFWKRILSVLALLALAGWLALSGAVFAFVKIRHEFTEASYLNIVWPPNWPKHRESLGRFYIARAKAALEKKDYSEAVTFYGAGIARAPKDITSRRELAVLFLRFGDPGACLNLLKAGLEHALDDLEYLKLTFSLLSEMRADAEIIALVEKYLPATVDDRIQNQFLALQAAQAHYYRGNYDAAEKIVTAWRLGRSLEGQLLLARCDWERGYPELGIVRLEQQRALFPNRDELPLQLIRFYRDLGRQEEALNEALLRHVADPASPGARVDLMYSWRYKNDQVRYSRELDSYLHDYSGDAQALLLLAWFAADTGELDLAKRLHALATERGFNIYPFDLVMIQTLIARGEYKPALEKSEAALAGPSGKDPRFTAVISGLRALAAFGAGDPTNGEVYLKAFLIRDYLRASDALLLAERLDEIGARNQARNVLETAVKNDPANQAALTALVKLEISADGLAALENYVPQLLAMRKPARTVLQEAYLKLDDATPARAALRQSIKAAVEKSPEMPAPGA
ncbi:tetratricopeptide repeat protein [Oleiharenicola lentus]|uniref:tetratricopeptide repeat protein n=1 Tax=Oleiharenicola lentus TaxID=2508720 RepID=UPI003F6786DC